MMENKARAGEGVTRDVFYIRWPGKTALAFKQRPEGVGRGNSQFKDPETRACSTYPGNIPEASVAKGGSEGAIWE